MKAATGMVLSAMSLSFLLASQCLALDLGGHLAASDGVAMDPNGKTGSCSDFRIDMEQSATELKILDGHFTCTNITLDWKPFSVEIRGTDLFYQGAPVGTMTDGELHASYYDSAQRMTESYDFVLAGTGYGFRYVFAYPGGSYTFTGTLQKQN